MLVTISVWLRSDVEAITKAIRKIQKQAKSQDKDRFQEAVALVSGSLQDQFAVLEKRLEENTYVAFVYTGPAIIGLH